MLHKAREKAIELVVTLTGDEQNLKLFERSVLRKNMRRNHWSSQQRLYTLSFEQLALENNNHVRSPQAFLVILGEDSSAWLSEIQSIYQRLLEVVQSVQMFVIVNRDANQQQSDPNFKTLKKWVVEKKQPINQMDFQFIEQSMVDSYFNVIASLILNRYESIDQDAKNNMTIQIRKNKF